MPNLTPLPPPKGYEKPYRFFRNEDTGTVWKVQLDLREVRPPLAPGVPADAAPAQLAVGVTVSPATADGKAMREDGRVIVIDSHVHTFTSTEMEEEGFSADDRIMLIVQDRIAIGEARQSGTSNIRGLSSDWSFAPPPASVTEPLPLLPPSTLMLPPPPSAEAAALPVATTDVVD